MMKQKKNCAAGSIAYATWCSSPFPSLSSVSRFWPAEARWPSFPCPRRAAVIQFRAWNASASGWRRNPHRLWLPRSGRWRGLPSAHLVTSPLGTPPHSVWGWRPAWRGAWPVRCQPANHDGRQIASSPRLPLVVGVFRSEKLVVV